MNKVSEEKPDWKIAQSKVADFLQQHHFAVKQEVSMKSGKRIDIVALRKVSGHILHVLVEVKDWNKVSRKQEADFCKQIIRYIIEYSIEDTKKPSQKDRWNYSSKSNADLFLGILCLTKDVHFSYRSISHHFIAKNENILGIPFREQLGNNIKLFVAHFDNLPKVFDEIGYSLYKESSLTEWMAKELK